MLSHSSGIWPLAHYRLSEVYDRQKRKKEAILEAEKATQLDSDNARFFVQLGMLEKQQQDFTAAEHSLLRAIELDPGLADAHRQLSGVYGCQKRIQKSLLEAIRATKLYARTSSQSTIFEVLHRRIINRLQAVKLLSKG